MELEELIKEFNNIVNKSEELVNNYDIKRIINLIKINNNELIINEKAYEREFNKIEFLNKLLETYGEELIEKKEHIHNLRELTILNNINERYITLINILNTNPTNERLSFIKESLNIKKEIRNKKNFLEQKIDKDFEKYLNKRIKLSKKNQSLYKDYCSFEELFTKIMITKPNNEKELINKIKDYPALINLYKKIIDNTIKKELITRKAPSEFYS